MPLLVTSYETTVAAAREQACDRIDDSGDAGRLLDGRLGRECFESR